ncbi:MAG TPA: diacylglycerol kinase family protein [Flavobacterium sp.]|jgi:diacylglycerol kinase (ATP)|uniref:diacylglycerol kinase n=1 Tax=Flavobacterium sp. TaxID=239 RepID=UPI002BC0B2C1|nr:diacylglycerol kinase family protein [Flavobacterium sp.]MCA0349091.1 diacylglycerol kinase family protein [Bacteroidota bacterium]HPW98789.1 diacylglycerol kinase family protein [Flavobacterium sp.]HQA73584.1 diacylglycerol kinase family protein [Flavobacterium sp.]
MEFKKDNSFFAGRIKSVRYTIIGAHKLITTEHSVMVQSSIAVLLIFAGFYYDISREEWMMQILSTGLVLAIEGMNTAVEKICDFIHPEYHEKIGFIKDIAGGAVLFAAIASIAVGLLIYVPKLM